MTKKVITSKNTSINKDKIPAIYGKLAKAGVYGTHLFDVGCGKWTKHVSEYAKENGICKHYHGFDKYNQPKRENEKVRLIAEAEMIKRPCNANIFISSNVLNVIDSYTRRKEYIREILKMMKPTIDELYITVYEGDRSGIGRLTKKDCWQTNMKRKDVIEELSNILKDIWDEDNDPLRTTWTVSKHKGIIKIS